MINCQAKGKGEGEDWSDKSLAGDGLGQGGINCGSGHDPKLLGAGKNPTETGKLTGALLDGTRDSAYAVA